MSDYLGLLRVFLDAPYITTGVLLAILIIIIVVVSSYSKKEEKYTVPRCPPNQMYQPSTGKCISP